MQDEALTKAKGRAQLQSQSQSPTAAVNNEWSNCGRDSGPTH